VVNLVETAMAEWGYDLHRALFELPLGAALALWPALLNRHGCEQTSSYLDKARRKGKAAKRKWLAEHFEIQATEAPSAITE
jgi:hypothetical protein